MKKFLSIAAAALAVAACTSGHDGWTLKGDIEGGAGKTVYIEGSTIGNWYLIDSVSIDDNGSFDYTAAKADSLPTIYRIRLADKYIYFPAQGKQVLTLKADAKSFDRGFDVSGSPLAAEFTSVDRLINKYIDSLGTEAARNDKSLKTELMLMVNKDTTCLASYYIVGKFIDKRPLLNLSDRADLRILGNAANNYKRLYPNNPRGKDLEQRYMAARRALPSSGRAMEAQMASKPDIAIARYDINGTLRNFDDYCGKGVTVLNFVRYDHKNSPANTVALNEAYTKYKNAGLKIYQISFDPDEMNWRRSAANMPWTSVWNSPTEGYDILLAYNVNPDGGPVSFIFDRNGDLVLRVSDARDLPAALARYF